MSHRTLRATALASAIAALPFAVQAADDPSLAQIREEIRLLKENYEARIRALESRLADAEANRATAPAAPVAQATATSPAMPASRAALPGPIASNAKNAFNPDISVILGGTYQRLSQDPGQYRLQGFMPMGDEAGPGKRSFNLGESELVLSANIDPTFSGKLIVALGADNQASVEEAFFTTSKIGHGFNLKGGRFLSSLGYLNKQHPHAWDFADSPLVYQAMFGGQYRPDGVQLTWLAPTDRLVEIGVEASDGAAAPGNDRNRNAVGAVTAFAHVGDDLGDSASWRTGVSYLHTGAKDRSFSDTASSELINAFTGRSNLWAIDGVFKWAPNGNATRTSLTLQGEYFWRQETGSLTQAENPALGYRGNQSGGYIQGIYKFMPQWRVGLRHDQLNSGTARLNFTGSALSMSDFPLLDAYKPKRSTVMLDYSPSEFSRLRLQFAEDQSRREVRDYQVMLQYIMSLGAHGAHTY